MIEELIVITTAIILLCYYFINHKRKLEKFYYQRSKLQFTLLQSVVFILMTALVFNLRSIMYEYMKSFTMKMSV